MENPVWNSVQIPFSATAGKARRDQSSWITFSPPGAGKPHKEVRTLVQSWHVAGNAAWGLGGVHSAERWLGWLSPRLSTANASRPTNGGKLWAGCRGTGPGACAQPFRTDRTILSAAPSVSKTLRSLRLTTTEHPEVKASGCSFWSPGFTYRSPSTEAETPWILTVRYTGVKPTALSALGYCESRRCPKQPRTGTQST